MFYGHCYVMESFVSSSWQDRIFTILSPFSWEIVNVFFKDICVINRKYMICLVSPILEIFSKWCFRAGMKITTLETKERRRHWKPQWRVIKWNRSEIRRQGRKQVWSTRTSAQRQNSPRKRRLQSGSQWHESAGRSKKIGVRTEIGWVFC